MGSMTWTFKGDDFAFGYGDYTVLGGMSGKEMGGAELIKNWNASWAQGINF